MSPRDIVAIFHSTFHATRGNIIDWSLTTNDIGLDGVEFSSLPSGLHQVDQDVVYLSHDGYQGVSVFRRVKTDEQSMRGYRLSSVGILVAQSGRPRPWKHLSALKNLSRQLEENPGDWTPLTAYFEAHKSDSPAAEQTWTSWEDELSNAPADHPTFHLPHILRILGPSSLTLFKHVLGRRRVLIRTQPPVEPACMLAQLASDICFGNFQDTPAERVTVLGMVGLNDLDRIQAENWKSNGWVACTTDAIFLEKPYLYDLVIDLTEPGSRPALYVSRPTQTTSKSKGPSHRLQSVRFTFSDLKLWSEIDSVLTADAEETNEGSSRGRWIDAWKLYEDVCMVCAGLWIGGGWKRPTGAGGGPLSLDDDEIRMRTHHHQHEHHDDMHSSGHSPSSRQIRTTLALLAIFHQHTSFILSRLNGFLPADPGVQIVLSPRDVLAFELGPLSDLDARFIEWLAERRGYRVRVRRTWKDLISTLLGFG